MLWKTVSFCHWTMCRVSFLSLWVRLPRRIQSPVGFLRSADIGGWGRRNTRADRRKEDRPVHDLTDSSVTSASW